MAQIRRILQIVYSDTRLYLLLIRMQVLAQAQYKANLVLDITTYFLVTGLEFITVLLFFVRFPTLLGWHVGEVALLAGVMSISFGLAEMIGAGIDDFASIIKRGEVDRVLLRPVGIFIQVFGSDFRLRRLGRLTQGILACALALHLLPDLHWTSAKVLVLLLDIASGAGIFITVQLLGATVCFWTIETTELTNILTYGGREMLSYPLTIYHQLLQRFFLFIVPVAFGSYIPVCYLLDRPLPFGLPIALAFVAPGAALVFALVGGFVWRFGVQHYQSTFQYPQADRERTRTPTASSEESIPTKTYHVKWKCTSAYAHKHCPLHSLKGDFKMGIMIDVRGLNKTFRLARRRPGILGGLRSVVDPEIRVVEAVQKLDLQVERGEMIGLVGPNGAGKSTTIKMLTGILMPTGGSLRVAGLVPVQQRRQLAARIGVVFGQRTQLWWDLPLADSLHLLRHLYRVPEARYNANFARLSEMLDLKDFLETPVRQLSLGQRMRGDLAAALLHDPELLYLDEPTIGLDVVAKARIRQFLLSINAEHGTTILLTTHDMDDVETLCPRMVIIDHGRKLYDGTVAAIRERFGGERTLIAVLDAAELAALPYDEGKPVLRELPTGVQLVKAEGPRLWLTFGRDALPAHELVSWLGARYRLRDVTFQEPEIEDVIRRIYEEGLLLQEAQPPEQVSRP